LDAGVLKVEFTDVVDCAAAFADTTSKSYVVPAVSPVSVTECAVVNPATEAEEPYPVVVPKFTTDVAAWSVVHVTVAELLVTFVVATFEISGGNELNDSVAKTALADVVDNPPAFAETTSKS
jgi:hypothetical protein